MSETKTKPTAQTVISLILPETDEISRQGSILAKYESADSKQSLAHLMPFSYSSLADIARAIEAAQQQLETLKTNPPQITVPTPLDATTTTSKPVKAAKPSPQKPKKKKVALDDIPDEEVDWGEADTEEIPVEEIAESEPKSVQSLQTVPSPKISASLQIGDLVNLLADAVDTDGDPVPFQQGRIVEIDPNAEMPRVWLESLDGEQDAWLPLATLTKQKAPANDLSNFEKPIGMGVPNKEGQLTLFG